MCKCGHDEAAHKRPITGIDNKGCTGEKLFDKTGEKLFDDDKGAVLQTQKSCDCKKFVARSAK
jgi:hypothetical protein